MFPLWFKFCIVYICCLCILCFLVYILVINERDLNPWVSQKLLMLYHCLRCRKHLYSNDNSQWQIGIWIFRDNSGTPKSSGMWTLHLMFFCKLFCCKGKYCPSCPKVRRRKDTSILYDYIFKTSADDAQRTNVRTSCLHISTLKIRDS